MLPGTSIGSRRRVAALSISAAVVLGAAAGALAAHPNAGKKYKGLTTQPKIESFSAPVSFTVAADGTTLKNSATRR